MKRPSIHFAPEKNWMNDPNGTVFANGTYHLFYQYNPFGSEWGNICWAYARSKNLIDWERLDVRLAPQIEKGEKYCFSGCAVAVPKGFKIFYTSIGFEEDAVKHHAKQVICDADEHFQKIERTGFCISADIHDFSISEWRDPYIFVYRNEYYMVLAGISDKSHIFLYHATDETLNSWQDVGILYTPPVDDIAECPNVAVFGDTIILLYSLIGENVVKYTCGTFDGKNLFVRREGIVDWGTNCFYATNLACDENGNVILFGWERESLVDSSSIDGTYSGCLALPRLMRLNECEPEFHFVDALSTMQKKSLRVTIDDNKVVCYSDAEQARMTFTASSDAVVEILSNEQEYVQIQFAGKNVSVTRHSLTENADESVLMAEICKERNEVDIVSDGTIVEILVNNAAISFRFYRQNPIKTLFRQLRGNVKNVKIHEMSTPDIHNV